MLGLYKFCNGHVIRLKRPCVYSRHMLSALVLVVKPTCSHSRHGKQHVAHIPAKAIHTAPYPTEKTAAQKELKIQSALPYYISVQP
jgi:hypothetical protein